MDNLPSACFLMAKPTLDGGANNNIQVIMRLAARLLM